MKNICFDLLTNVVFVSAASSWLIAQGLKVIFDMIKNGFSPERVVGGGGMPSSHSATVTGLTVGTIITYGIKGFQFPMALFFAIIVIYDAMGVRMETGKEAKVLNEIIERDENEGKTLSSKIKLNEMMGHTLREIIVGCIIGIVCSLISAAIIGKVQLVVA